MLFNPKAGTLRNGAIRLAVPHPLPTPLFLATTRPRYTCLVAPAKTRQSFEELYKQLEETVTRLEQGGLSLDDSLAAYEAAVTLAQQCQQLLDQAELRITKLRESFAVADEPEDYDVESESENER